MATACLFIGFNRPAPGHEGEANRHLVEEVVPQIEKFQKAGWFESHDVVGLTPHGGDLNFFLLLRGERAKLDELRRTDEFERFSMRLNRMFTGYGVIPGVTGDGIPKVQQRNPDMFK